MSFSFGDFELDESLCTLRESGHPVTVQPKVFDLLCYLLRHRDRVVSKQELLDALWPGVSVGESSLTRAVNLARLALHDDGRSQRMIQTVARRGYRLVAPVEERPSFRPAGPSTAAAETPPASSGPAFIGRDGVMTRLEGDLRQVLAGQGRCVAISGEPGIGKTRTVEELAERARALGAGAFLGWCYEGEGAPPYWPWVQILRAQLQEQGAEALRARLDPAEELVALLPEFRGTGRKAGQDERSSPEASRFRLFESLALWLRTTAAERPLVLIFDDVHWADPSSLRMFEFIAREIRQSAVLLVVTYRDDALDEAHPLRRTLALLARSGASTRIALQGLTREEVGRLVETLSTVVPSERLVEAIHDRTAGNPFFVHEVVLSLAADGRLEALGSSADPELVVPPAVRDVIAQRLLNLSSDCRTLLRTAAVIGSDFDLRVLRAVTGLEESRLITLLDEARRAHLLHERPGRAGTFRFRHALVQEALYADQSQIARNRLHEAIGEAIVSLFGASSEAHAAALAHHFCRGARPGEEDRAIAFAREAARRAMRLLAYEEASRHYGRALEAFELAECPDETLRTQLLIEQGRAFVRGGDGERAEAVLGRAAAIARDLRCPILLSRAALTLAGDAPSLVGLSPPAEALLEEALGALGTGDPSLRVRILSRLCAHFAAGGLVERAAALGDEAVALASGLGDAALQVAALNARNSVHQEREGPADRCRRAREAIARAAAAGLEDSSRESHLHLAAALLESGDLPGFEAQMAAYTTGAREDPPDIRAWYGAVARSMRLSLSGLLEKAEEQCNAAFAMGRRLRHPDAAFYFGFQLTQIRFLQGRLDEIRDPLTTLLAGSLEVPGLRAILALVDSQSGRTEAARSALAEFAARGFTDLPRDAGYLSTLSLLALVCSAVGDATTADQLRTLFEPLRGRNVCAFVVASNGAVEHFLGLLALRAGRSAEAVRALRAALDRNQRMQAVAWELQSRLALARALSSAPRSRAEARELAASALAAARRLGMRRLAEEATGWLAGDGPSAEAGRRSSRAR